MAGLAPRSHSLASPSLSGSAGPGEVSGLREGSGNMAGAELDRQGSAQQGQARNGDLASASGSRDLGARLQSTGSASPPALAKARQGTGPRSEGSAHARTPVLDRGEARHRLRMTLHVEERARLSAMVETLRRALVTAHADLHGGEWELGKFSVCGFGTGGMRWCQGDCCALLRSLNVPFSLVTSRIEGQEHGHL